jgi:OOP family OmpA-OmpF porin
MSKRKIYLSALCATLTASAFTYAPSTLAVEENGFSIGVDYGRTEAKKYCDNITNCESTDKGPKIEIGYDFNKNFGVELGYTSFGTVFDADDEEGSASITQKSNAITLSLLGTVPVVDWFSVYGRIGYAHFDTNNKGSVEGVRIKDEDGYTPFWGLGGKFNLNEQFAIRVEYQSYSDLSDLPGRQDDVQGMFAGVVYRF